MYLYSVGTALSNQCTYRRMTEAPILFDLFYEGGGGGEDALLGVAVAD